MSVKYEVGSVGKHVPLTKPAQSSWSKQSLNLFGAPVLADSNKSNQAAASDNVDSNLAVKSGRQHAPGGNVSSSNFLAFPSENSEAPVPSTKVHAAPGGKSTISDIFGGSAPVAEPPKSTIRLYAGATSNIFSSASATESMPPPRKANPNMVSSIFTDDQTVPRSSTRVQAAPGGSSQMNSTIFSQDAPIQPVNAAFSLLVHAIEV